MIDEGGRLLLLKGLFGSRGSTESRYVLCVRLIYILGIDGGSGVGYSLRRYWIWSYTPSRFADWPLAALPVLPVLPVWAAEVLARYGFCLLLELFSLPHPNLTFTYLKP